MEEKEAYACAVHFIVVSTSWITVVGHDAYYLDNLVFVMALSYFIKMVVQLICPFLALNASSEYCKRNFAVIRYEGIFRPSFPIVIFVYSAKRKWMYFNLCGVSPRFFGFLQNLEPFFWELELFLALDEEFLDGFFELALDQFVGKLILRLGIDGSTFFFH